MNNNNESRNPCFTRMCFAIKYARRFKKRRKCRNPCFTRMCFAM